MNPDENELQATSRKAWESLPRHPDEEQVQLDVDRAFVYYPRGLNCLLLTISLAECI